MKIMMRVMTVTILGLCLAAQAEAQDRQDDRIQVRAGAGGSIFGDDDVIILHRIVGVTTDFRLIGGLRVGPEIIYHKGPGDDRDVTVIPSVSYDFRRLSRVAPFVSGGVGVLRHDSGRGWSNSLSFGFGGGVKLGVTDRLFIAPEIRVGWDPFARAMVSVGYRF